MRTKPSNIINACIWCNHDHDPAIQCRMKPENPRFDPNERKPPAKRRITRITDAKGNLIATRTTRRN
jgi:hypothetical protein